MKFCCTDMMYYFREGHINIDYDYDSNFGTEAYTPIVKFNDSWHNFNYCPFCGNRLNIEVEE